MQTRTPKKQNTLGKTVRNFNKKLWHQEVEALITPGITAKFTQNEQLKILLLNMGKRRIGGANPHDTFFGIAIHLHHVIMILKTPKIPTALRYVNIVFL